MKRNLTIEETVQHFNQKIRNGIFLTTTNGNKTNSMTIAWSTIGFVWNKNIVTIYVRPQRYTYEIIKDAEDFTINIPLTNDLDDAIRIFGTKSGRDTNKFEAANINLEPSTIVLSPSIQECEVNIECRIIYRQPMCGGNDAVVEAQYPAGDYHEVICGEILAATISD